MLGGGVLAHAEDQSTDDLKARVAQLEALAAKEGLLPSGAPAPKFVSAMSDITISGFVQASYFYNTKSVPDGYSDGYLWNTKQNSFSINKVKLTVAGKPVATDKWDATFRASFMWGEDAPDLNSGFGSSSGEFNSLREAFVELNVPVGTGIDIKAGELISLLNWESGDGGAANPNFSQGNQWWFTGNGPSAGIQGTYNFTDKVGLTLRVDNGLFQGPIDANNGKAFSASLAFKPTADLWFNLIGWYSGNEFGNTDVSGGSVIGGFQVTKALGTGWEVDYFNFDTAGFPSAELWSIGGWAWYDFTPKVGLAFRADYTDSPDGSLGPSVRPGAGIFSVDTSGSLSSFTLTLNLKPTPNIKIQPEVRFDTTTFSGGLDGHDSRVIIGAGVSYLF